MKGYFDNLEQATLDNTHYRHVLYTAKHCQLVLMSIAPNEAIGEEVHPGQDQFIRFEAGEGQVIIDGNEYTVGDGSAVIIPAGSTHNVINTSTAESLKLYTVYSPPHHQEGTLHTTKADETEEDFDGVTTESPSA